jgi:hypothetical protein
MSWVWLDGVESFEKEKQVKAWKRWEESFPQCYLIELIAQAGAILLGAESGFQEDIVFIKIEGVEFLSRPEGGKRLEIEAESERLRREGGWFSGRVFQEGKKVLQGRILLMNVGRLRPQGEGSITFPKQLREAVSALNVFHEL